MHIVQFSSHFFRADPTDVDMCVHMRAYVIVHTLSLVGLAFIQLFIYYMNKSLAILIHLH